MTEAVFPLFGAAFVVLCVLPAFALLAKLCLCLVERYGFGGPLGSLNLRYIVLTSASTLPLAWFLSAGLHQAESSESALACLFEHDAAALCFEPEFFALTLLLSMLGLSLAALRQHPRVPVGSSRAARNLLLRVENVIEHTPALSGLRGRVAVTDVADFAVGTLGLLRPKVFIGTAFAAQLSDAMLTSALGHEHEHVRARDPLRYLLLELALGVNPLGRWLLAAHAARWQAAREAHCDREAVIHGAAPLPLADAIIRAARPGVQVAAALGARDTAILRFRVSMLLAFAEQPPARCCHRGPSAFSTSFGILLVALLLPHQTGTAGLDAVHTGAERALIHFWR